MISYHHAALRTSGFAMLVTLLLLVLTASTASALEYRANYTVVQTAGAGTPRDFSSVGGGTPITRADDTITSNIPIGFTFYHYGMNFTTVNMNDNGILQFQTVGTTYYAYSVPSSPYATPLMPFIAGFWSDLKVTGTTTANVTYATVGSAPNRVFVARYSALPFYYAAAQPNSFDIELYETTNVIKVHYYSMGYYGSVCSIGVTNRMHDDFTTEYTMFGTFNSVSFTTALQAQINDTTLTFTPGTVIPYVSQAVTPVPYSQGTYAATLTANAGSLTTISGATSVTGSSDAVYTIALGFSFWFYGANFSYINLNTNGVIQFATASSTPTTETLPSTTSTQVPFIAFAFSNWYPYTTGMISYVLQSTTVGSRVFRIRYASVPHYSDTSKLLTCDVLLKEADWSIEVWYTNVPTINQPLVVGIQSASRYNVDQYDYSVVVNNLAMAGPVSTGLTGSMVRFTVVNASIANNALPQLAKSFNSTLLTSVVARTAMTTSATTIEAANDNSDYIPFGFPYRVGSSIYTGAYLTTNGELQFASAAPIYDASLTLPLATRAPVLMFFYTDLYPLLNAERSYQTTGTYPNRVFILRHDGVPYATTATSRDPPSVSLDVVIYESDYRIEVRYYNVPASSQLVVIGIQASANVRIDGSYDAVALINGQPLSTVSTSLNQTTWLVRPLNSSRIVDIAPSSYTLTRPSSTPARVTLSSPTALTLSSSGTYGYYTMYQVSFGFNFTFYGVNYTSAWASVHGYLQWNSYYVYAYWPYAWPSGVASYAPYLAVFNTYIYLYGTTSPAPVWQYATIGTAPYRSFVMQWMNMPSYYSSTYFQGDLLLNETTNAIEMRYYSIPITQVYPVAIGVIGSSTARLDGSYDMSVYLNAVYTDDGTAVDLTASPLVYTPGTTVAAALPDSYAVTATPLSSTTPPTLYGQTYLSVFDESSDAVPLGFMFMFYDVRYSFVNISSEGYIQFSSSAGPSAASQMPITLSTTVPLLAFFWTNLYVPTSTSWMYVTTGAYPNRVFTLRLSGVQYSTERNNATIGSVTLDLQLYELDGKITVSYYSVSNSTQKVLVGLQGSVTQRVDHTYDYTTWVNLVPLNTAVVNSLNGMQLTFTSTSPVPTPTALTPFTPSYTGTYNASHSLGVVARANLTSPTYLTLSYGQVVSNIPIGFAFYFFSTLYSTVRISGHGNLQFATTSTSGLPGLIPGGNSALVPFIAYSWTYLSASTNLVSYGTIGTAPYRSFIVRLNRVLLYSGGKTLSLDVVLNERDHSIEIRYYAVYAGMYYTMSVGVENAVASGSPADYAVIVNKQYIDTTLAARLSFSTVMIQRVVSVTSTLGQTYNVTRVPSVTYVSLPSARSIEGSNDNIDTVPIGFPFVFYGATYSTVQVSSNGDIQFATQKSAYSATRMPLIDSNMSPYLAYFYTDLYPMADTAKQYDSFGTYPDRQFVLRLTTVPYASTHSQSNAPVVSIDVVLIETDYRIEVRYHRVDVSAQTINVGSEGAAIIRNDGTTDSTIYLNQVVVGSTVAAQLQGSTLVFNASTPITRLAYIYPATYNVTSSAVPDPMTLTNTTSMTLSDDTTPAAVSIGFNFTFYSTNYSSVVIAPNGNLQFASSSSSLSAGSALPTGGSSVAPAVMFAYMDLYPPAGGTVVYTTMGTAPNRYFVVRFWNIGYFTTLNNRIDLSCDVILYETSGDIIMRYYRIMQSSSYMVIGVQASTSPRTDGTYDYTVVNNYLQIPANSAINGTQYRFFRNTAVGGADEPDAVPRYYAESYADAVTRPTMTTATGATVRTFPSSGVLVFRAGFSVPFFGSTYTILQVSTQGVIGFGTTAPPTAAFALPATLSTQLPLLAPAFSNMTLASDAAVTTQTTGSYPSRVFLLRVDGLRYVTVASSGVSFDVRFYEQTGVISVSYYRIDQTTQNVLIGLQASATRRTDYTYDFLAALNYGSVDSSTVTMLLNKAVVFTPTATYTPAANSAVTPVYAGSYTLTYTPSVVDRVTLSSPSTTGVPTGDDAVSTVSLQGMSFTFLGTAYTSINVGTNGNIQFATTATAYVPSAFPSTSTGLSPFLAPFWTDLYVESGMIQFQLLGTAPYRSFVLRYNALRSLSYTTITIDADIVLFESTNAIEYRYYQMGAFTTNVQIGFQGTTATDYATAWNAVAFGQSGVNAFWMTTVTITPPLASSSSALPSSSAIRSSSVAPSSSVVPSSSVQPSSSAPLASSSAGALDAAGSSSSGLSGGAIAGVVIGVIVGVVLIVAIVLVVRARSGKGGAGSSSFAFGGAGGASAGAGGHAQLEESVSRAPTTEDEVGEVADHGEVELATV